MGKLLFNFFDTDQIAGRVIGVLEHQGDYTRIRENVRRTVIENHDLKTICLPGQLALLDQLVGLRR